MHFGLGGNMTTKADIISLLKTNNKAVARALVVLTARQTATEQNAEQTINRNGEGFRPCHARMGTSMAKFFEKRGYLTPKQIEYWRKPMKTGQMRIEIYAGQLLEVAKSKAAKSAAPAVAQPSGQEVRDDLGNIMEERMVLAELLDTKKFEYNDYLDSDDEPKLAEMDAEIKRIEARINELDDRSRAILAPYRNLGK